MTPPPIDAACQTWRRRLAEAESAMSGSASGDASALQLRELRDHLDACPGCTRSHGSRLSNLEARLALRSRSVPDGLFDGFYERLETEARMAPLGGGMSLAFLDAPRALHAWRMAALSAGLLLLIGVAWVSMHGAGPQAATSSPLDTHPDGPAALLVAWPEETAPPQQPGVQIRPAQGWGGSSPTADDFYRERGRATPASVIVPPRRLRSHSSDFRRD